MKHLGVVLALLTCIFLSLVAVSPCQAGFTDISSPLTGVSDCRLVWGDYDNDGDLDLAVAGWSTAFAAVAKIYRNDNGTFVDIGAPLTGVGQCSLAWGDYDNDGDLDLALAGYTRSVYISKIYRNDNGTFVDIGAPLTGVVRCSVAWGDYDNDGDLDLALAGSTGSLSSAVTKVYRNDYGVFTDSGITLPSVSACSLAWGDYDNDGDLDLALAGEVSSGYVSRILRNNNGTFTDIGGALTGVSYCSLAWGDYDNDGDLDLALTGFTGSTRISKLYRNNNGVFTDIGAGLSAGSEGNLAWGDYDNDGDLDLAITGNNSNPTAITKIYRSDGGTFTDTGAPLVSVSYSSLAWGDFDNDGDLDLALAGGSGSGNNLSKIYRNDGIASANTSPTAPTGLSAGFATSGLALYWNAATDAQTPAAGLCYNIRVGSAPGGCDIFSGMANAGTGLRRLPATGNAQKRSSWTLRNVPAKPAYYCSVQAIDTAFAGSAWSAEAVATGIKISGHVRMPAGVPGVSVAASGASTTTTDADGSYQLTVPKGWTGTVTPIKAGYWFAPASRSYANVASDVADQDILASTFTDTGAPLQGVDDASVAWGDYDNDGDLDLVVSGEYTSQSISRPTTRIYRNDNGTFVDIGASLGAIEEGSLAWGDYDNDGDLDLALAGYPGSGTTAQVYRNDNGTFVNIAAGLTGVYSCSLAWGDYDNDGDLDLALAGDTMGTRVTKIYRNDSGKFIDIAAGLPGVESCSLAWGDYDNDGDLDLALAGDPHTGYITKIYRNNNGIFTDSGAALMGLKESSLAWGDYDNDGDLDLAIAGSDGSNSVTKIYRNDNGLFVDSGANLTGVRDGSIAWGDYDSDGDLDLAISGGVFKIYRNDGGTLTDSGIPFPNLINGSLAWGDCDNDGDLDLAFAGVTTTYDCRIYKSDGLASANNCPAAPTGLSVAFTAAGLTLTWSPATDSQTPAAGLCYNIKVGSTPGSADVYSGMADPSTGLRRLPATGNAQKRLSWSIKNIAARPLYYCSVQAIDSSFAGSAWSAETVGHGTKISGHVMVPPGLPGVALTANNATYTTTDAGGYYELIVPSGWSGTVTPTKAGYSFVPPSRSYNNVASDLADQDFSASGFGDIGTALRAMGSGDLAWGDYDNDGDLDLVITGGDGNSRYSKIYRNDQGVFTDIAANLMQLDDSSVAWGDYDNDGDLDLALAGHYYQSSSDLVATKIYRNDNGVFTDIGASLTGVRAGKLAWGDYNNDGMLDLVVSGTTGSTAVTKIYRNKNGSFVDSGIQLPGFYSCSLAWGDYDNDGDLDLAIAGNGSGLVSKIYRNDAGSFTDIGAGLTGVYSCSLVWGDYDHDGDLDLVLAGYTGSTYISKIYHNNGSGFTDSGISLTGVSSCSLEWGDYDNDGDLDLVIAGYNGTAGVTKIYRNDNSAFVDTGAPLAGVYNCSLAWGDYDNDGDLDLVLAGHTGSTYISRIYRNDALAPPNTAPSPPTEFSSDFTSSGLTLAWNAGTDSETPSTGLSYNIRVGSTPGGCDIFSGAADAQTGTRRMPAIGNAQEKLTWSLRSLPSRPLYYCSVQTIDGMFAASPWAAEVAVIGIKISGHIRIGYAVSGVSISADNNGTYTTTDSTGYYELTVPKGWSGNVTPVKASYWFIPVAHSYANVTADLTDQDFTGCTFGSVPTGMAAISSASLAWGNYDNDGDLDLAITGYASGQRISRIYRNNNGVFSDIGAGLTGVAGCIAWGDYDNDGDLDLAIAGQAGASSYTSKIYRNDGGTFLDIGAPLTDVYSCSLAWGDCDNDGDLDLGIAGLNSSGIPVTRIYRNDRSAFTDTGALLAGVSQCSLVWGDYDNDGDLDLAIAGLNSGGIPVTRIYRNDKGVFTDIGALLTGVSQCSLAWGDYDNDGDLDLAVAGQSSASTYVSKIYRNDSGSFTDIGAPLTGVYGCSLAWGDYDNDGDPDLAIAGQSGASTYVSKIYRNDGGIFTDIGAPFSGVGGCSIAWGDYDGDGDLDLALAGGGNARLYRNDIGIPNTAPAAPTGLTSTFTASGLSLSWQAAPDSQTPAAGLSYNIRVGSTPGGCDVFSGMADAAIGLRRLPATGNAQKNLSWNIGGLSSSGTYYWSVQAVDPGFAGSPWAAEQQVQVGFQFISGHIRTSDGQGVALVSVSACGGGQTVLTDSVGRYNLAVPSGWSGEVVPASRLYWFDPPKRSYVGVASDQADQDFVGAPNPVVSGVVTNSTGAGVSGVTVAFSGGGDSMVTGADGNYQFVVPRGWTGAVSPSKAGYLFSPASRTYNNVASDQTGQGFCGSTFTGTQISTACGNSVAWGDYDNDGDLDLAVAGSVSGGTIGATKIYRNDNGQFVDIGVALTGVYNCSLAWGDYDNDGDLDLAVAGAAAAFTGRTKLYRNDNGTFSDIGASLPNLYSCSLAWGDYDNDGDLDLAMSGYSGTSNYISKLYRSDNGVFTDAGVTLTGVFSGSLAWGDYDNDGDLDLVIAGSGTSSTYSTKIYRNDNGSFVDIGSSLTGVGQCSVAWGDYDNDGDLDLAIAGTNGASSYVTKVYRNDNGSFVDIGAPFTGVSSSTVAWGDFDNDGDLDLAVAGSAGGSSVSKIYRNDNGAFAEIGALLSGCTGLAWGDCDNDGDLDLALVGYPNGTVIYRNDNCTSNTPPAAPSGLTASLAASGLTLSWNAAVDAQTPPAGLSYNIKIGSAPGKCDVFSGMADTTTGKRQIAATGNAQKKLSWSVASLRASSVYYCSVEAIDTVYAASPWADFALVCGHKISGHVRADVGLAGVTMSIGPVSTVTDANGYYELLVPDGWSGSVTPRLKTYWFGPDLRTYSSVSSDLPNQDFLASGLVDAGVALPGVSGGRLAWGDYDNDGDLDLAITGNGSSECFTRIYRNDKGSFVDIAANLTSLYVSSLAWGDYDNDGDLDLAVAGQTNASSYAAKIYRNDNGAFVDSGIAFGSLGSGGVGHCSIAWGDYDNDGRLDLAIAGTYYNSGSRYVSRIYHNNGSGFTDSGISLTGVGNCSLEWGDYDNDGDLDLVIAGYNGTAGVTKIYRNDNSAFVDTMAPLTGVYSCSLAWGDYDNDGDLDLAVSGQVASGSYAGKIYRNDNGTFVDIGASLAAVYLCSLAWGDYDNDGNLDLAVSGLTASGSYVSRIYRNVNGVFSDLGLQLVGLSGSSLAWGDYDNDGNLDLALTGAYNDGTNHYVSKIYHNVNGISMRNTSPAAPTGLWAGFGASGITLSWNAATDAQAPAAGLSYNVRIGSTRGGCDLFSGMASSSTGLRKLPATGNAQKKLSWTVKAAPWLSRCYASVQAIDTSFAGSPWAVECSYTDIIRAKSLADETSVSSSGIVTAVFGDVFYIEKDDCTSGIRVSKTSHGAKIGDRVTASGVIRTLDGERYIAASSVTPSGTAVVPAPFGMNANSVGGGTLGLQLGVSDWRLVQDSVTKAWNRQNVVYGGPNNIGLLVRIAGKVSHLGNGIFYLDGACPFDDGDPSAKGICVAWPFADAMPADGALVQMTAVSSCTIRYGHIVRLLRPISASSVVPVP